jgi:hypothetical protein
VLRKDAAAGAGAGVDLLLRQDRMDPERAQLRIGLQPADRQYRG